MANIHHIRECLRSYESFKEFLELCKNALSTYKLLSWNLTVFCADLYGSRWSRPPPRKNHISQISIVKLPKICRGTHPPFLENLNILRTPPLGKILMDPRMQYIRLKKNESFTRSMKISLHFNFTIIKVCFHKEAPIIHTCIWLLKVYVSNESEIKKNQELIASKPTRRVLDKCFFIR